MRVVSANEAAQLSGRNCAKGQEGVSSRVTAKEKRCTFVNVQCVHELQTTLRCTIPFTKV